MMNSHEQNYVVQNGMNQNQIAMESQGRLHEDVYYQQNYPVQQNQKQGFCSSLSKTAKILLILLIILAIIAAIVIPIAVVLGDQDDDNDTDGNVSYSLC